MELIIDQERCDLNEQSIRIPALDLTTSTDPNALREGRTLKLTIPTTPRNDRLIGFGRDPESATRFNASPHTATLAQEGITLIEGRAALIEASDDGYTLQIKEGGTDWAHRAARTMLHQLEIDYSESLIPQTILESWSNESPVKFFPIHRDDYAPQSNSSDLLTPERILTVDDYHPFLHIATLVEQLFAEADYTIQSHLFSTEFFRSLYMSGAYPSRDTTAARNKMGFVARRLGSVTATADYMGRVYADPAAVLNTVGNLVESATPMAIDEEGEVVDSLYNNGHCFNIEEGRILFRPLSEVSVGFEFFLKYTTDHRILSRERLTGFDTIYVPGCGLLEATLTNRYQDQREALRTYHQYRALVFDHVADARYRLLYTLDDATDTLWATFDTRSALVTTPETGSCSDPKLQRLDDEGLWVDYEGDWALYHGHIEECGYTEVEMRFRTPAEVVSPDNPKYFDQLFFEGAEEGMRFTLDKSCSLRPDFCSTPGYGSRITFATVARGSIRQIELLEALTHLFNLRFLTDEERRTVRIDPAEMLYGEGNEVDWRERSHSDEASTLIDRSGELHKRETRCYAASSGAVARLEADEEATFGAWSFAVESEAALEGEHTARNPLFAATLNSVGHYLNAPSARLLQVGDRDVEAEDDGAFSPRIVSYRGLVALPDGERWGSPSHGESYPLAVFHLPPGVVDEEPQGVTLCFDDRDGVEGLRRYHEGVLRNRVEGGSVEQSLRLTPGEYALLMRLEGEGANRCSRFRLRTSLGECTASLRRIGAYDPDKGVIRCTFDRIDR